MSALFTPTSECQDVPPDAVLPPGLEYELNMETGTQRARLPQNGQPPSTIWIATTRSRRLPPTAALPRLLRRGPSRSTSSAPPRWSGGRT
jgi:hypothetical protein